MSAVFFDVAVRELLTGSPRISFPVGPSGSAGPHQMTTNFENAAHLRLGQDGAVQAFRKQYSLTILMSIGGGECFVQGIVNPEPEFPLSIHAFPKVPFARLRQVGNDEIEVEWIVADPRPIKHYFIPRPSSKK
jgi:hypothetical protein